MNSKSISTDRPVKDKDEDRFQRYEFSRRIADLIIKSESTDSVVYGIYGAWGEGKTSILNFIKNELAGSENIITIRFNPWRFTDEATLLVTFFNTLAKTIKENIKTKSVKPKSKYKFIKWVKKTWNARKTPLQTEGEAIGEVLQKYGKLIFISGVGDAVEKLGNNMINNDIDVIKERFEKLLIKANKKLVVFIDDIDRLDKQEIHSIFRLVKLTADFSNTIYILSFDQEMVASAIGDRFGEGNKDAGRNFLEKIIQVPLKIPVAQPSALKKLCFELVDQAISESDTNLSEEDAKRFISAFSEHLMPRLKTPRLAIRYGNALLFSLPLLKGEANQVDLMLIEAVRIFFPDHYEFIKKYPGYFITAYINRVSFGTEEVDNKKKELFDHFEKLSSGLTTREQNSVKYVLIELFPRLNEAFNNTSSHDIETKLKNNRRIGSPEYFNRYFTYCVLKGEISDVSFDLFINNLESKDITKSIEELKNLISQSSIDNFLQKIRSQEDEISWDTSLKLIPVISQAGDILPNIRSVLRIGGDEPMAQAAIFIYQLLKKHGNSDENFKIAQELMRSAKPFEFAYEINNWLRYGEKEEDKLFTPEQYMSLAKLLRDRANTESDGIPLFIKYPDCVLYLYATWKESDPIAFEKYIKKIFKKEPKLIIDFMVAFTPTMISSAHPGPFKASFSKKQYDYFKTMFDVNHIHSLIISQFSEELPKEEVKFSDFENVQSNINILRQFEHWYKKETTV